jgi:hypothetical protein
MNMMKNAMLVLFLFACTTVLGQQLSNFNLTNVLSGQQVSFASYPSCDGMVIIFTSNTCPYDEYYRDRITKLAATYSDKIPVLLVNAGTDPSESNEMMLRKSKELNSTIPYLADKDQKLMTALDAHKSPEAFLLKNSGGSFTVIYRGAIDDNPQVEADVRAHYLQDAITALLSKQKPGAVEMRPVGCNLKKKT